MIIKMRANMRTGRPRTMDSGGMVPKPAGKMAHDTILEENNKKRLEGPIHQLGHSSTEYRSRSNRTDLRYNFLRRNRIFLVDGIGNSTFLVRSESETPIISNREEMKKLVISNKALKLAEKWVDGMSKLSEYETTDLELEPRPSRLGLGAKVPRHTEIGPLNDPADRKLFAKINATKRKASQLAAENTRTSVDNNNDSDTDEDEPSGRSQAFSKKKATPSNVFPQGKKKKK